MRPRRHRRRRPLPGLPRRRHRHPADAAPRRRHLLRGTGDPRRPRRKARSRCTASGSARSTARRAGGSCAAVARAAARISVRDEASRALLESLGVAGARISLSADPAFLLAPEGVRPEDVLIGMGIEPEAPIAGIALRPWSRGVEPEAWEREVAAGLDLFLERTAGSLLFVPFEKSPWSDDDDFALASRVRRRLEHADRTAVLSGLLSPGDTAALIGGCDLVVGMRLHSIVFAVAGSVPPVAIAYDPKVEALLERSGLSELVLPIGGLSAESLAARMELAHAGRGRLQPILAAAASAQKRLAESDLDALGALVENPPAAAAITPEMIRLFDDALSANLARTHELTAEADVLRADRIALELHLATPRLASRPPKPSKRPCGRPTRSCSRASRRRRRRITARRPCSKASGWRPGEELFRIHNSRVWKTLDVFWRARRAAARVSRPARQKLRRAMGEPPSDWAGPDTAREAAAKAPAPAIENRCEIVLLPASEAHADAARRLGEAGHRVFPIDPGLRATAGGSTDALFDALDAMRREKGFGATLCVVTDPAWRPVAERLRAERAWALATELGAEDAIAAAFPRLSVVVVTWNGLRPEPALPREPARAHRMAQPRNPRRRQRLDRRHAGAARADGAAGPAHPRDPEFRKPRLCGRLQRGARRGLGRLPGPAQQRHRRHAGLGHGARAPARRGPEARPGGAGHQRHRQRREDRRRLRERRGSARVGGGLGAGARPARPSRSRCSPSSARRCRAGSGRRSGRSTSASASASSRTTTTTGACGKRATRCAAPATRSSTTGSWPPSGRCRRRPTSRSTPRTSASTTRSGAGRRRRRPRPPRRPRRPRAASRPSRSTAISSRTCSRACGRARAPWSFCRPSAGASTSFSARTTSPACSRAWATSRSSTAATRPTAWTASARSSRTCSCSAARRRCCTRSRRRCSGPSRTTSTWPTATRSRRGRSTTGSTTSRCSRTTRRCCSAITPAASPRPRSSRASPARSTSRR